MPNKPLIKKYTIVEKLLIAIFWGEERVSCWVRARRV